MGRSRAFTLIEAVVAIVILGVAVPAMVTAVRTTHDSRSAPIMTSRARWLAAEKLEDVIADRNSATRGFAYLVPGNYPPEASVPSFPGFTRKVTLTQTTANLVTPGTGYMVVCVTASWTDPGGVARSLSLSTVLTSY